jgi:hypothetical protein
MRESFSDSLPRMLVRTRVLVPMQDYEWQCTVSSSLSHNTLFHHVTRYHCSSKIICFDALALSSLLRTTVTNVV